MMSTEANHFMFPRGTLTNKRIFSVSDWYTGTANDQLFGLNVPSVMLVAQGTYWTNVDCKN